ncbi:hypothetical protein GGTG_09931 [Gaeumannomyces tritici R3-111a-1]|uniref:Uncharacterized protein n=1 Tax=Gaeumannomyces tritici (strain R3-111a-1) TaxID=644352 RepID=J3P8U7_GAET3|nr:hypothetical protein GGTG_09931 [Gaeumannomyces tritici R3-111a-1]EJT73081.1 hypothetical protein GGTG_09931 [Gaeumannomyces tritici R3-111a-1]
MAGDRWGAAGSSSSRSSECSTGIQDKDPGGQIPARPAIQPLGIRGGPPVWVLVPGLGLAGLVPKARGRGGSFSHREHARRLSGAWAEWTLRLNCEPDWN